MVHQYTYILVPRLLMHFYILFYAGLRYFSSSMRLVYILRGSKGQKKTGWKAIITTKSVVELKRSYKSAAMALWTSAGFTALNLLIDRRPLNFAHYYMAPLGPYKPEILLIYTLNSQKQGSIRNHASKVFFKTIKKWYEGLPLWKFSILLPEAS
jgi:hypothetical protein